MTTTRNHYHKQHDCIDHNQRKRWLYYYHLLYRELYFVHTFFLSLCDDWSSFCLWIGVLLTWCTVERCHVSSVIRNIVEVLGTKNSSQHQTLLDINLFCLYKTSLPSLTMTSWAWEDQALPTHAACQGAHCLGRHTWAAMTSVVSKDLFGCMMWHLHVSTV